MPDPSSSARQQPGPSPRQPIGLITDTFRSENDRIGIVPDKVLSEMLPERTAAMQGWGKTTIIRDVIVIDEGLAERISAWDFQGRSTTVQLLARKVRHKPGFTLAYPGLQIAIFADIYDGAGGRIDVSGRSGKGGADGAAGRDGGPGSADTVRGERGWDGDPGGHGGDAGSVRLSCWEARRVRIVANGGNGGRGGHGGDGGDATDTHVWDPEYERWVYHVGRGGDGGHGSHGGDAGDAGEVIVTYVTADSAVSIESKPGVAGSRGNPGTGGSPAPPRRGAAGRGFPGQAGLPGRPGATATARHGKLDRNQFQRLMSEELGRIPKVWRDWIDHRLRVAEFHYRGENTPPDRDGNLRLAVEELGAILRLDPNNRRAQALRLQILSGMNVLGLPRDLDILPKFEDYADEFTQWGPLVFGRMRQALAVLLAVPSLQAAIGHLQTQAQAARDAAAVADLDRQAVDLDRQQVATDSAAASARLDNLNQALTAALAQADAQKKVQHGDVLLAVGEVVGVIVALYGVVQTGGAAIPALFPDIMALGSSFAYRIPGDISGQKLDAILTEEDITVLKAKAKKVGTDISGIVSSTTTLGGLPSKFVNTDKLIRKLSGTYTPDMAPVMALTRQLAEATVEHARLQMRARQIDLMLASDQARIDSANDLSTRLTDVARQVAANVQTLRRAALDGIKAAENRRDTLIRFSFHALRSLEILTAQDASGEFYFDSGFIHPDLERDYAEGLIAPAAMMPLYEASWDKFLSPIALQERYEAYFSNSARPFDTDILRLSFADRGILDALLATGSIGFTVAVEALPAGRFDTKIQGIEVALVGATSPSGVVSCKIRHGPVYEQRLRTGEVHQQNLLAREVTRVANTSPLVLAGVDTTPGDPLTTPQDFVLWGRGLGGQWTLTVPDDEITRHGIDLSTTTEIQVWLIHQFTGT